MSLRTVFVSSFVMVALAFGARTAAAQSPNQAFLGRIMMSSKRFPQQAKSPSAYTAQIRKQAQTNFVEAKDTHTWKIYFAGFLKVPLNDLEYVIKLYDVSGKSQQMLVSFDQFTNERGQQTIVSNMTLDKKQVGVNKELMMTMESKVDFSEDEASGKKSDDE